MNVSWSDWHVEDNLRTPEARAAYLVAATEEGTPDAIPDALADVFRSMGKEHEAIACDGLATYLRTVGHTVAKPKRRINSVRRSRVAVHA